jgi:anti-sigma factor RsiW
MTKQCNEYELLIVSHIDDEASDEEKREVFRHLAECGSCRTMWESLSGMKLQAAREKRSVAPARLDKRINAATIEKPTSARFTRVWGNIVHSRVFIPMPVAVLFTLFILIGSAGITYLWSSKPQPAREVVEPVVYMKLPTVEVRGSAPQSTSTVR